LGKKIELLRGKEQHHPRKSVDVKMSEVEKGGRLKAYMFKREAGNEKLGTS